MKSYKLCHYAVALGKHAKHSKTRLCEASLASCQTQKPFPAISGTLHSRDNQNISRLTRKPSTIMVVKIPHCELRANIQQVLIIGTARESISYGWHWEFCTHVVMLSQTQPSVQLVIRPWKAISYVTMQSHWENMLNIPKHGSARRL